MIDKNIIVERDKMEKLIYLTTNPNKVNEANEFYGESKTLSELREIDYTKEATFWGDAKDQFAKWYKENYLAKE